ncbi:MAG TPA: hypothetical protein VH877_24200 [Polyangia bacterium]|jgi:hypothetical protein|nr:hypothetical protein [Polyangia bacterium]
MQRADQKAELQGAQQKQDLSSPIWEESGTTGGGEVQRRGANPLPPAVSDAALLGHGETTAETKQATPTPEPAEAEKSEKKANPQAPVANFETLVEQLSHGFVARDLSEQDRDFLQVNGYRAGPILRGKHEFVMRAYHPTADGKPPIVAFRGTVPSKVDTLIADVDPRGIGVYQFKPNQELIRGTMEQASSRGPVVSTGHSLGGALAQMAAIAWPDLVSRIITFQAPGVEREAVAKLQQYNAEHPDHQIESSHHRVAGDLVPLGGEALTPGTIHVHQLDSRNPLAKHLTFPLAQEELAEGNTLPVQDPKQKVTFDHDLNTADDHKPRWVEALRKGVGLPLFGIGGAVHGVGHLLGKLKRKRAE